jgi:hypothetical protein
MESDRAVPPMKGKIPRRSIFFYPDRPQASQLIEHVRHYAGWEFANRPETADWCWLFQDATWVTLPEGDPYAEIAPTWINGCCRDISKRTVEQVFDAVFGYPLAIEPLTYQGLCLRKSNRNYVKDVTLLTCPIPAEDVDAKYVYERLVDGRVSGLGIVELPTFVVGGRVVSVTRIIRPDWISTGTFGEDTLDVASVYPTSVFSAQELEQIAVFCEAMGLEYGKLDIIRDTIDQRISILDANTTPGFAPNDALVLMDQLVQAFLERYPPCSTRSSSPCAAVSSPGTNGDDDGEKRLAMRLDAQAARIAQLEAAVDTLSAGIARISAAFSGGPPQSGKKTRKNRRR